MIRYVLVSVLLFPTLVLAQHEEPEEEFPGLKLELVFASRAYELGTPIDVVMRYTYTGDIPKLGVWHIGYDRSGRVPEFRITATDADGKPVVDPIENHLGGFGGGDGHPGPSPSTSPTSRR